MRSLVWFRRDLRVQDNSALFHAAKEASDGTVGVFLMTPGQWKEHDDADLKIWFWLENLRILSAELEKLNIPSTQTIAILHCWPPSLHQRGSA